jgi:hypothetical protein
MKTDHYDHPSQFTYHNHPTIQQQESYAADKPNVINGSTMKVPRILTLESKKSALSLQPCCVAHTTLWTLRQSQELF